MILVHDHSSGYGFLCECTKTKNLLSGTIWESTKISQDKILLFLFLWIMNLREKEICLLLGLEKIDAIHIDNTLNHIISEHYVSTLPKFTGVVEIDESCFRKNTGAFGQAHPEKWVFGIYERETKRVYMEVVTKRTTAILLPII